MQTIRRKITNRMLAYHRNDGLSSKSAGDVVTESVLNTNSANSQRVHNLPHAGPRL